MLLLTRPHLGRRLFAIDWHDEAAERHAGLYRLLGLLGYDALKDNPHVVTTLFGGIAVVLGIVTVLAAFTEG